MPKGLKTNKGTAKALILLAVITTTGFISGCGLLKLLPPPAKQPGLYDLRGWGGVWAPRNGGEALGIDINGEVGHPVYVDCPRCNCVTAAGEGQAWNAVHNVLSGSLPPGLKFGEHHVIVGIPTDRGHWIVRLELNNIECGDSSYSFQQELRFHITGTGKVF